MAGPSKRHTKTGLMNRSHSDQPKDLTMTSKIETTKREMYRALAALKSGGRWLLKKQNAEAFETALEEHLEENRQLILAQRIAIADLFMTKCTLVRQVEHLVHESDVLKDAARIAGEKLRSCGFSVKIDERIPDKFIAVVGEDFKQLGGFYVNTRPDNEKA